MASRARHAAFALLLGLVALFADPFSRLSNEILDTQFSVLRINEPVHDPVRPFILGIDDRSHEAFPEPFALWHPYIARTLDALAQHRPAVVAFDIALPTKDFSGFGPTGNYDSPLIGALARFRRNAPDTLLVFVAAVERAGEDWSLVLPDRRLLAPLRPDETSFFVHPFLGEDPDGRIRRISTFETPLPSLAAAVATHLRYEPRAGLIDYRVGSQLNYLPLHQFLTEYDHDEAMLAGRVVLIGDVTPFADTVRLPVPLATWNWRSRDLPGVIAHAQVIRSFVGGGIHELGIVWRFVAVILAAALGLLVLGPVAAVATFLLTASGMLLASTLSLHYGVHWDSVPALLALGAGIGSSQFTQARDALRQRRQLRSMFSGYVGPTVMDGILDGSIKAETDGERREVALLFSDVRGFTTMSEKAEPESIITLLNRYFDAMVPIVHAHGGTVDKFLGDGLMVIFGAPQSLSTPSVNAVRAAQEMLAALERLNSQLAAEGLGTLRIGVGIHAGPAVIGHVGAKVRNEYTAIGDTVNLAARLESMTKAVGQDIVFSRVVAEALEGELKVKSLGVHEVKGREAVEVFTLVTGPEERT